MFWRLGNVEKAEENSMVEAKKKLTEAQQALRGFDPNNTLIKTLRFELKHLPNSLKSHDTFKQQVRLFATPRMDAYLEQAKAFEKDPNMPLPTSADDAKQELAADPLGPIAGALSYRIQSAIQSLQAIASILEKSR